MDDRPRILITLRIGGENGGPYVSHYRIMASELNKKYYFTALMVPRARELMRPGGMWRFVRQIKSARPDIVHFSGLQLEGFLVSCAARLAHVQRTILAVHGSSSEAIDFSVQSRVFVHLLEVVTLRRATVSYAVSDYVLGWDLLRRHASHCYGRIYNLPHRVVPGQRREDLRRQLRFRPSDIVVVAVGRVTREKGFDFLLDVFESMDPPDSVRLLIVGEGEYLDAMKARVSSSGRAGQVVFAGFVPDISSVLESSDILALFSAHETLGNAVIEAGMHSLPCVVTNVGGLPEVIRDGVNGFVVQPGDSARAARTLQMLIGDARLRAEMGRNARENVNMRFSECEILGQLDELYQETLNGAWD